MFFFLLFKRVYFIATCKLLQFTLICLIVYRKFEVWNIMQWSLKTTSASVEKKNVFEVMWVLWREHQPYCSSWWIIGRNKQFLGISASAITAQMNQSLIKMN